MRYDLMVTTALALAADDPAGRVAQWRQLVDLIVQARGGISAPVSAKAVARVKELAADVPLEQRRLAATQLGTRARDADGVALFGVDHPIVAAPVLTGAQLDDADWQLLIPQMPPASRALLRNRRDLPDGAVLALASFGSSDFALPSAVVAATEPAANQIRDLVARIEAFRESRSVPGPEPLGALQADHFAFECDAEGLVNWVSGAPREALIGTSLAQSALIGGCGVDGQASGAFRRRAPFQDARLTVEGFGPTSGAWLISAAPVFNPRDGRFAGYHGSARRPRADEVAGPVARVAGTTLPVDSLRQLVHELRTPLNAILGFAEMIDQQLLGPAITAYRARASEIVGDGQRLLDMVEDLDQAARAGSIDPGDVRETSTELRDILHRIEGVLAPALLARRVRLKLDLRDDICVDSVAPPVLERMLTRLIGAVVGLAGDAEIVTVTLGEDSGKAAISVSRPPSISGLADVELLDPGYGPGTPFPEGPLLGLGFTLRLVDSLARDGGGRLAIDPDQFIVSLPTTQARADLPAGAPQG